MFLPPCGPNQTRIGISFPVPQPWANEIELARIGYGDEYAEMIPPHITIIGPTAVNNADLPAITVQLDNICDLIRPFTVRLDGTGTFRPLSPVAFIRVTEGFDECVTLQAAVHRGKLASPKRFDYHPHVTLAHGVPEPTLDRAEAEFANLSARFPVEALWLYHHEADGVWRKAIRFDLRGR